MNNAMLHVKSGPLQGKSFPLVYKDVTIGRLSTCRIRPVGYTQVSREHARIYWNGSSFIIEDMGSKNRVKVNRKEATSQLLSTGDIVEMGDFTFEFRLPAGDPEFIQTAPALPVAKPNRPTAATAIIAVIVLVVLVVIGTQGKSKQDVNHVNGASGQAVAGDQTMGSQGDNPTSAIVDSVKDSTVIIAFQVPNSPGKWSMGSGFVVGDGRTIVTNRHVVAELDEQGGNPDIQDCLVVFHSGTSKMQKIVIPANQIVVAQPNANHSVETDLAVLRLPQKVVEPLPVGDTSALRELQKVWVIGFPHGIGIYTPGNTMPAPSVQEHSVERLQRDSENQATVLQMGGSATHGNSGSPVINSQGEVVGVLEGGPGEGESIKYAVPSSYIKRMLEVAKP